MKPHQRLVLLFAGICAVVALAGAGSAFGATAAPGYAVSD